MLVKKKPVERRQKDNSNAKNSDCVGPCIAILIYAGFWMPDSKQNKPWLYVLYAIFVQTFFFHFIVAAEIGYLFTVLGDTQRLVEAGVLLLSHLVQGVKMLTVVGRQQRIKRLIAFIDGPLFQKEDPSKQAMLTRNVRSARIAGQVLLACAAVTAVFWSMVPGLKADISLPLKIAFPFDIYDNPMFTIMYAYATVSVIVVGVSDAAVNYLASGLMMLPAMHLDVLVAELEENDAKGKSDNYEDTVRSIKYHQNIIEYVKELAKIFGLPIFCQFIATSLIVCMTLYKITVTSEPVELTTMIFYLSCVFLELLMYCYPGDLIITKSLLVAEAASPGTWSMEARRLRSRHALLLCSVRAQRALCVNAGGVFRASLSTAAAVLRAAYSYYAVLQQKMDN